MYRILIKVVEKVNNASSYRYMLNADGSIYETDDLATLDAKVEELLLTMGKNDFDVVSVVDYEIDALINV